MAALLKNCFHVFLCSLSVITVVRGQDPGDIVNALTTNSEECGDHAWQVVDIGANCGTTPCSFPKNWCSDENGLKCVKLSNACQKKLKSATTTSAGVSTTTIQSTTAKTTTAKTTTARTTTARTTTVKTTTVKTTTSEVPTTTTDNTVPTTTTVLETTSTATRTSATVQTTSFIEPSTTEAVPVATTTTEGPTIAPATPAFAIVPSITPSVGTTTEPPLRPLPVGSNGTLLVLFKQVGDGRPTCPDNSNFCCYWAKNNECNDNAYFMQTYCRRSCQDLRRWGPDTIGRPDHRGGLIAISGDDLVGENAFGQLANTCQDLHPRCRLWASRGECRRNSLFMISMCKSACGLCPCQPKCRMSCSGGYGGGYDSYGGGGGTCQRVCSGCGR